MLVQSSSAPVSRSQRQAVSAGLAVTCVLSLAHLASPVWLVSAHAQTNPAVGPRQQQPPPAPSTAAAVHGDTLALADYLALLHRISPAAETGARHYLAALQLRCGHAFGAQELRLAMSQVPANPSLQGFIRAAHLQDKALRARTVDQLRCPPETKP